MEWLLAHQGGWDEALMFGIPIALAIVAVKFAERRAAAKRSIETSTDPDEPGS